MRGAAGGDTGSMGWERNVLQQQLLLHCGANPPAGVTHADRQHDSSSIGEDGCATCWRLQTPVAPRLQAPHVRMRAACLVGSLARVMQMCGEGRGGWAI